MKPIYLNDWAKTKQAGMLADFKISKQDLAPYRVLLASYTYSNYEGSAYVLLRKKSDRQLYDVVGSHCSCYGLEGQWSPSPVTKEAILMRKDYALDQCANEVRSLLSKIRIRRNFNKK